MKKLIPILLFASLLPHGALAQIDDDFRKSFNDFNQQVVKEFADFRQQANMEYADFMQRAWEEFKYSPAIEQPRDKQKPPVVVEPEHKDRPRENKPVKIKEIITLPSPLPRPEPLSVVKPVIEKTVKGNAVEDSPVPMHPQPQGEMLTVSFYGTDMTVRMSEKLRFKVAANEKDVARLWRELSGNVTDNTLYDCLDLRDRHRLSDWAYLRLLDALSDKWLGKDTSESELLKAFLYCQSGYQMRLAFAKDRVVMLYGSPYIIYGKRWWNIDGGQFYSDFEGLSNVFICNIAFPGEKPMSASITSEQQFSNRLSSDRVLDSAKGISVTSGVNVNYIDFCNDFPSSQYGEDPITRWAIYANTPTSVQMREQLYPQLRDAIKGLSNYDAVNALCNWVQTAFVYEYDDKVWGADRAFFADETLYYPYCDCEDRSILLTRIVRDLLNLKCALVYYPGHLATAVALGEDATGDFIRVGEEKFLVCDPTYINAPIGRTMPGLSNDEAKLLILD